jgi:hypothetical protein
VDGWETNLLPRRASVSSAWHYYSPKAYDHWGLNPNEDGDCAAIYDCIVDYYDKNPDPYIDIIKRGDDDEDKVQEDDGSGDEE